MVPFPSKLPRPATASPRESTRAWLRRRSPAAQALAALIGVSALSLAAGALFPVRATGPGAVGYAFVPLAFLLAATTLLLGHRLSSRALLAEATAAVLLNSVLVAAAKTRVGAAGEAICYMWLTLYVAAFFPYAVRWFMPLVIVFFTLALVKTGLANMESVWFLISVTTLASGAIVARLSRGARAQIATDALTGLLNRAGLEEAAERMRARVHRREDSKVTVAVIDLDGFKLVNDSAGHAAGDRLLADTAAAWRDELRQEDVLARVGGDEFVMVLPGTSHEQAHEILERLRSLSPIDWSAGVADWPSGESLDDTLLRADQLLYAAKARG